MLTGQVNVIYLYYSDANMVFFVDESLHMVFSFMYTLKILEFI